ncbi:C-type lectin-like protein [Borealpox virus]|nr:C-type lectin-like protein [Alaskapox virus]
MREIIIYRIIIAILSTSLLTSFLVIFLMQNPDVVYKPLYKICPKYSIGAYYRCFYFSNDTSNWTYAFNFCKMLNGDLVTIKDIDSLNFMRRYKDTFDYWVGLHRERVQNHNG